MQEPGAKVGLPLPQKPVEPTAIDQTIIERKNGLPVMRTEDYERFYNTDIRALGEHSAVTFDYQGYVRTDRGDQYVDSLATNGILRDEGQEGIHVGTDGIHDYRRGKNDPKLGPEDIREYNIAIMIPGKLQRQLGVYCQYDNCHPVAEFDQDSGESLEEIQSGEGWIVMRTTLDPESDPLARVKAELLHSSIVKALESGRSPADIEASVRNAEEKMEGMTAEELSRRMSASKGQIR